MGQSPDQGRSPRVKVKPSGEAEPSPHIRRHSRYDSLNLLHIAYLCSALLLMPQQLHRFRDSGIVANVKVSQSAMTSLVDCSDPACKQSVDRTAEFMPFYVGGTGNPVTGEGMTHYLNKRTGEVVLITGEQMSAAGESATEEEDEDEEVTKHNIHSLGVEQAWYQFRLEAFERIAIEWLEREGIPYERDDAIEVRGAAM